MKKHTILLILVIGSALMTSCGQRTDGPASDPHITPEVVTVNANRYNPLGVPNTMWRDAEIYRFKAVKIHRDTSSFDSWMFKPVSDKWNDTLSIAFQFFSTDGADTMEVIAEQIPSPTDPNTLQWSYWEAEHWFAVNKPRTH